jgi:pyrroline-5-carboxylate reductase
MGEAFVAGLLRAQTLGPGDLLVVEVDPGRRSHIENTFSGIGVASELPPRETAAGFDLLLVAVKPADLEGLLAAVVEHIPPTVTVLSIAAGVRISSIRRRLGPDFKIVRAMPNLGATVGVAVSAYAAGDEVTEEEKSLARQVLEAVGPAIEVPESKLNAVTAISGSGPAYVFLLAEAMEKAAKKLGMSRDELEVLIPHTVLAAGLLLVEQGPSKPGGRSAMEWREAVTSKGGTTEAALKVLDRRRFTDAVVEAVEAAAERAAQLDALDEP